MTEYINIAIPSKPEMVSETDTEGVYEISGLYPGYGNTLGNAVQVPHLLFFHQLLAEIRYATTPSLLCATLLPHHEFL